MHQLLVRSSFALAIVLAAGAAASAQDSASSQTQSLKARCDQLISYYDRYGAGRSENSDGVRNHTRIAAGIECDQGHYSEGIADMEALLKRKNFDPSGSLATPWKPAQLQAQAPR